MNQAPPKNVQRLKIKEFTLPMGVEMLIEPLGLGKRHKTQLIGLDKDKYIIVRFPPTPKVTEYYHHARKTVVQYRGKGGYMCGFKSVVVGYTLNPYPLLFLQYPDEVNILEMREHERLNCFLPVTVNLDGVRVDGLIVNLSPGGCKVSLETEAMPEIPDVGQGSELTCSFNVVNSQGPVTLEGMVKTFIADDQSFSMGVEFTGPPEEVRGHIARYAESVKRRLR